jgi:hypothetical protein
MDGLLKRLPSLSEKIQRRFSLNPAKFTKFQQERLKMTDFLLGPLQEKWLKELESEKYKQGRGYLCQKAEDDSNVYCCLGIAAEFVLNISPIRLIHEATCEFGGFRQFLRDFDRMGLDSDVGSLITPFYLKEQRIKSLADMNDKGWTFKEIAAYIRSNPENVFTKSC